jgi:hypothetical protein
MGGFTIITRQKKNDYDFLCTTVGGKPPITPLTLGKKKNNPPGHNFIKV